MLRVINVEKSFGGVKALDRVNLEIGERSIIGLIGPNGSGKSTLINVISGIIPLDSGEIYFNDIPIHGKKPYEIANLGIIRTFQVPRVFKNLSVIENMLIAARMLKGESLINVIFRRPLIKKEEKEIIKKALEILEFLEIEHLKNEYAKNLSGGQQKLLALGRALMANAKLMLLDEPIAGVAPKLAKKIFRKIEELRRNFGISFLIVEHNIDVLLDFCDEMFLMDRGRIVLSGKPIEVLKSRELREVYLGVEHAEG